jgi:predicted metal-dependent hydrolase
MPFALGIFFCLLIYANICLVNSKRKSLPTTVDVWGKKCKIKFIKHSGRPKITFDDESVKMYILPCDSTEKINERLEKWYKKILTAAASAIIKKWEPVIKVKITKLTVRKMRTRFGVARRSEKKDGVKYITLAVMLAKYKPEYVEYVIVHEMVHLIQKRMDHSREFYKLMDKFLPEWKKLRKGLKKNFLS